MNRHERRKAGCLKRRERRATIKRVAFDPVAASAVYHEFLRRKASGQFDVDANVFEQLREISLQHGPALIAPEATE